MDIIEEFFKEMENLFLPLDKEAFAEIKEDLQEHIQIQLGAGKTKKEILKSLGSPQEIVEEFYEEQRMHTALHAAKDVIPVEEVGRVYKNERSIKRTYYFKILSKIVKFIVILSNIFLVMYLIIYFGYELFEEQHFAFGPFGLIFFLTGLLLLLLNIQKVKILGRVLLGFGVLNLILITLTNNWFYIGNSYYETIPLTMNKEFNTVMNSDFPVNIVVIQVSDDLEPWMEVNGHFKSSTIRNLNKIKSDGNLNLNVDSRKGFDLFTKIEKAEILLFFPTSKVVNKFDLGLESGEIKIVDLNAENIDISIKKGTLEVVNMNAEKSEIYSKDAGIVINDYYSDLDITNKSGKTIVRNGEGSLMLKSETGYINVENVVSNIVTIGNISGKIEIVNTVVDKFNIYNNLGNIVVDTQSGDTYIDSIKGEVILRNLKKKLKVTSENSRIIVTEMNDDIKGEINADSGVIKWIQLDSLPLNFAIHNELGDTNNQFGGTETTSQEKSVIINSKTAKVMIIKKNKG
jgi:uncharacterized membrane protein